MKALVIDDSRATRAILRRILGELGHDVVEAADGQEGLDALEAHDAIAFALVDWNMPVMDGLAFLKEVRSRAEHDALPIMMVTTEGDTGHMMTALEAGANEYAMKPFTASVIEEKLTLLGVTG